MCIHLATLNHFVRIVLHQFWKTSTEHLWEKHLSARGVFHAFSAFLAHFSIIRHPSFSHDMDVMNFFVHIMTVMMYQSFCNQKFDVFHCYLFLIDRCYLILMSLSHSLLNFTHSWKGFIGVFHAFSAILAPFSIIRHPSLWHDMDVMNFFVHIMTVMIHPSFCNQKFEVLRWAHQLKLWKRCQKRPIFRYFVISPYK